MTNRVEMWQILNPSRGITKISESLIHELLETTKMYIGIPYNAIFMFVAYDQYKTLHFFEEMIYNKMLGKCGPKVSGLLRDIYFELEEKNV